MTKEKFTLFYRSKLGQWNMTPMEVDGVTYNCCEQYMMAEKAKLFGDEDTRAKIMDTEHPRDQQALGRLVKNFDQQKWDASARDIVYKGNYAKFSQNENLRKMLLATAGTTLVEASPYDPVWGIKLSEDNPDCHDRSKWKGTNWLGEVLTKVREDLIAGVETTKDFNWLENNAR